MVRVLKSTKKKSIFNYLFDDLRTLSEFVFNFSENMIFSPVRKSYTVTDENDNVIYTIKADPSIKLRDIDKFNSINLEREESLISVGIDASSVPSQCLCRGNTRFLLVKPYVICASGDDAQFILEEMSQTIKYLILISDKLYLSNKKSKKALYPHYKLQNNLVYTIKHIKEGKIFADFLENIVQIAIDYGYKYDSNKKDGENLIIFKDGSILSNSEIGLSHAIFSKNTKRLESFLKLYNSIKTAGKNGIPIVGIVKDSQSLLLSKLFYPFSSDYHIVRNLAFRQKVIYSYLNPIKKIIEPHKNIEIDNYFTFLERDISPLRLEVIPLFKPKSINNFNEIIEKTIQLINQNNYIHEFHKRRYKLPYSVLKSDQQSRSIAHDAKTLINEKLNQIKKRIPFPMKIKQGFE